MANYNTFVVVDCKNRKSVLTTSSARKANKLLTTGFRIDVWNNNEKVCAIYEKSRNLIRPYITLEKDYIREKQAKAEKRNKRKRVRSWQTKQTEKEIRSI